MAAPQMRQVAAANCRVHRLGFDRDSACFSSTGSFKVLELPSKRELGEMKFNVIQKIALATKGSRTWTRAITLHPTFASGAAVNSTIEITFKCGKGRTACRATKEPAKKLTLGKDTTYRFTFTSPGSATLTHNEKPVSKIRPGVGPTADSTMPKSVKVRCDSVPSISGRTGGCVHPVAPPTFGISRNDPKVREAAEHIWDAQRSLPGSPGLHGKGQPLHRTTDKKLIAQNRRTACPDSLIRPAGQSCDEYPFASTKEGGASGNYSRRMIDKDHNSTAGGSKYLLKAYKDHRILDGDAFWVAVG